MEYINSIAHSHAVLLSASILLVAYIFIATEKISKVYITGTASLINNVDLYFHNGMLHMIADENEKFIWLLKDRANE